MGKNKDFKFDKRAAAYDGVFGEYEFELAGVGFDQCVKLKKAS